MSTWIFNVVLELVEQQIRTLWIQVGDPVAESDFINSTDDVVAKCHHFDQQLADAADFIVYSYRDLRTAAVSSLRKFDSSFSLELLDSWIQAGEAWRDRADIVLRYERTQLNPVQAIQMLRREMAVCMTDISLVRTDVGVVVDQIDQKFSQQQHSEGNDFDKQSMIFPKHRTFQPQPEDLNLQEKKLYDTVSSDYSGWLVQYHYFDSTYCGMGVGDQIAEQILNMMSMPVVIDVGMGRGCFSQLALDAGAKQVFGFEALPRHLQYLQERYSTNHHVQIFPQAVSNQSGSMLFHVAVDRMGVELDYAHSLRDFGDTNEVVRSGRSLDIDTVSLGDLANEGAIPSTIDLLRVDTDGYVLPVLEGMGKVRPRFILAKYKDALSGICSNSAELLTDLGKWAQEHGYHHSIVVRHNQRFETVEWEALWSIPGDWGYVFFMRDESDKALCEDIVNGGAHASRLRTNQYLLSLARETEVKSAEITRLINGLNEMRAAHDLNVSALMEECRGKDDEINRLADDMAELRAISERNIAELTSACQAKDDEISRLADDIAELRAISERNLAELTSECLAKDDEISRLAEGLTELRTVSELNISNLTNECLAKETEVTLLTNRLLESETAEKLAKQQIDKLENDTSILEKLHKTQDELLEKEAVIQEQSKALDAYRSTYRVLWPVLRPLNFSLNHRPVSSSYNFIMRHGRAVLRPRLGNLNQHPPRHLRLPSIFNSTISPDQLPSISIVTPSFNQGEFVRRTIRSVLDQGYPNLQYFVQDGGSEDDTVNILQEHSGQLAGWVSEPDDGQSHAINLGFSKSTGEIMAWLNSDDLLLPGALAYVAEYFVRHPEVDVVYGHRILIDEEDREIGRWVLPGHSNKVLEWADFVPQETLFWRRSIWEKAGGAIDEDFHFAIDWDLLLRFRKQGARMVRLPRFLGAFRIHNEQKTSSVITELGFKEMDRLRQREIGRAVSHTEITKSIMPYLFTHVLHDLSYRALRKLGLN